MKNMCDEYEYDEYGWLKKIHIHKLPHVSKQSSCIKTLFLLEPLGRVLSPAGGC